MNLSVFLEPSFGFAHILRIVLTVEGIGTIPSKCYTVKPTYKQTNFSLHFRIGQTDFEINVCLVLMILLSCINTTKYKCSGFNPWQAQKKCQHSDKFIVILLVDLKAVSQSQLFLEIY